MWVIGAASSRGCLWCGARRLPQDQAGSCAVLPGLPGGTVAPTQKAAPRGPEAPC